MEKTVVWFFGSEHEINPFIGLGIESLSKQGFRIILSDLKNKRYVRETIISFPQTLNRADDKQQVGDAQPKPEVKQGGVGKDLITRFRKYLKSKKTIRDFSDKKVLPIIFKIIGTVLRWSVVISYKSAPLKLAVGSLMVLLKHKPSVVICSNPYFLLMTTVYKRLRPCRMVYYPFELVGEQVKTPLFLETWIEKWFIRSSIDGLITQNECRAAIYEKERRARVKAVIVHNYKQIRPKQPALSREEVFVKFGFLPDQRLIVYEGFLVPGRNLENLVLSLKFLDKNIRMLFVGKGNKAWWAEAMDPIINQEDIQARFTALPFTTGDELHAIISAADAGVILYDRSCRNNIFCEPGKLSDYLEAGIPVLVPDFPTIRPVIDEYQIGVCINENTPEAIAKAVKTILSRPREEWVEYIKAARSLLSWETQEPGFIGAVTGQAKLVVDCEPLPPYLPQNYT